MCIQKKLEGNLLLNVLDLRILVIIFFINICILLCQYRAIATENTQEFTRVKVYFSIGKHHSTDCICNDPVVRKIPKTNNVEKAALYALEELMKGTTEKEQKQGYSYCIPVGGEIARYKETYSKIVEQYRISGKIDDFGKQFLNSEGKFTPWGDKVRVIGMQIKDSTAYADFSKELYSYGGGSCRVEAIETAIVNTVKQFPNIKRVHILVEGKEAELQP